MTSILRVVLDINIYVRLAKAKHQRRTGTAAQRIFSSLASGQISGRPAQIVVSHRMLDTLTQVLTRLSVPAEHAEEIQRALLDAMRCGPEELDPHLILGGAPDPSFRDVEDGGVMATAFGARAHVLVTDNLDDFATRDCEVYETALIRSPNGSERRLKCLVVGRPDRREVLVVHPVDFALWIGDSFDPTPKNVRTRYTKAPVARGSGKRR